MKIAIVIDSIAVRAGIERVVTSLANIWAGLGYHVTFVTKDNAPAVFDCDARVRHDSLALSSVFSPVRIIRYAQKVCTILTSARRMRLYFAKNHYDFIYSASPDITLSLYLGRVHRKTKVLASEHGAYDAYNLFFKLMKHWVYPKVYAVIAITEKDAARYRDFNKQSYCMHNPLGFTSKESSPRLEKTALAVGRLVHDKGYDRMIDMWAHVSASHPDWVLRIIGDGELKESLNAMITSRGLQEKIIIAQSTGDIRKEYLAASLYLMTSYGEGFGMVLVEAMECGLPCIAFDCPVGPGEIISGGNGILVANGDVKAFVTAVKKCIDDPAFSDELSRRGKESAERFSPEKIAAKWRAFYESAH